MDEKLLWQNNKVKEYYSELTEIVRNYIGRDIEIPTFEQTSNEIIELIEAQNNKKKLGLSKETIATINSLLRNADLVKFAKSKPLSHEIEDDRKFAELIITKIQPKVSRISNRKLIAQIPKIEYEFKKKRRKMWTNFEFLNPGFLWLLVGVPLLAIWHFFTRKKDMAIINYAKCKRV